jgi:hypothetical protein
MSITDCISGRKSRPPHAPPYELPLFAALSTLSGFYLHYSNLCYTHCRRRLVHTALNLSAGRCSSPRSLKCTTREVHHVVHINILHLTVKTEAYYCLVFSLPIASSAMLASSGWVLALTMTALAYVCSAGPLGETAGSFISSTMPTPFILTPNCPKFG